MKMMVEFKEQDLSFEPEFGETHNIVTTNHALLNNRDKPDQHPISSITGLEKALGASVGKKTAEGGEVFNDYEKNYALSPYTSASGKDTVAGVLGYYYYDIDIKNKKIYLTDEQGVAKSNVKVNYAVGDKISIVYGTRYLNCSTIESIQGSVITVDALPIKSFVLDTSGMSNDSYSLYVVNKPLLGLVAFGNYAHSEGANSRAYGRVSHAEGNATVAMGKHSHAEGIQTYAVGESSHSEGSVSRAQGDYSHTEGEYTVASGRGSHAEGQGSSAEGDYSHAEGRSRAIGNCAHSEGKGSAEGDFSHAEGTGYAVGTSSHAEGSSSATASSAHAEGSNSRAEGMSSHAEGHQTNAVGDYSHSEGYGSYAIGNRSHAEGSSYASGAYAHSEGNDTHAEGESSHAEGFRSKATGSCSHAEGTGSEATGGYSHAEGSSKASNEYAHSEGQGTQAQGVASHAEGYRTNAKGNYSHAEGNQTNAQGESSHAEGHGCHAYAKASHVEGISNHAIAECQHLQGRYSDAGVTSKHAHLAHVLGNGYKDDEGKIHKSNAHTIDWDGNAWFSGNLKIGGTKYEDADAKVLATEEYVDEAIANIPTGDGSGGEWELLQSYELPADAEEIEDGLTITFPEGYKEYMVICNLQKTSVSSNSVIYPGSRVLSATGEEIGGYWTFWDEYPGTQAQSYNLFFERMEVDGEIYLRLSSTLCQTTSLTAGRKGSAQSSGWWNHDTNNRKFVRWSSVRISRRIAPLSNYKVFGRK